MLNKLHLIIFKMCYAKRPLKTRNILANVLIMFFLTIILPSLLIFWTIFEGRRTIESEQLQIMEDDVVEKETYNWKPLLEKIDDRKRSLATNCQYLVQHHKQMFSNENVSYQNNNCMFSIENTNSVICDVTGITEMLFCSPDRNSLTCSLLQRKDANTDDLSHTINTFLVVQHPFKRIVSIYKRLSENRKREIQKLLRFNTNGNGAKDELLFKDFVTFLLHENQLQSNWLPIQKGCSVCSTTYDYIINMENIQEEKGYLLYRTTGIEPPYQSIDNLEILVPSEFEVNFYFSKLRKDVILKLYQLFRLDFELFNYKLNTYLSLGIDVVPPTNGKIRKPFV